MPSNSARKWSEIRSFRDLSNPQWQMVRSRLNDRKLADFEQLKDLFKCNQRTVNRLLDFRRRTNKPRNVPRSVDNRLPELLEWLGLTDELSRRFDGAVYLASPTDDKSIPYVGMGNDERIARWDGHAIDAFRSNGSFHLACLEGLTLWAAVLARGKPKFTHYPAVCEKCEEGYRILAKAFGDQSGEKIGREEFIAIVSSIADHQRISA